MKECADPLEKQKCWVKAPGPRNPVFEDYFSTKQSFHKHLLRVSRGPGAGFQRQKDTVPARREARSRRGHSETDRSLAPQHAPACRRTAVTAGGRDSLAEGAASGPGCPARAWRRRGEVKEEGAQRGGGNAVMRFGGRRGSRADLTPLCFCCLI